MERQGPLYDAIRQLKEELDEAFNRRVVAIEHVAHSHPEGQAIGERLNTLEMERNMSEEHHGAHADKLDERERLQELDNYRREHSVALDQQAHRIAAVENGLADVERAIAALAKAKAPPAKACQCKSAKTTKPKPDERKAA